VPRQALQPRDARGATGRVPILRGNM
jgi:hypothetical protein